MLYFIISFLVLADLLALVTIGYVLLDVAKEIKSRKKRKTEEKVKTQ